MTRWFLPMLLAMAAGAGCADDPATKPAGDAGSVDAPADTAAEAWTALLNSACAPDDGPAVRMILHENATRCGDPASGDYVHIVFFDGATQVFPLTPADSVDIGVNGFAGYCTAGQQWPDCDRATGGSLFFDLYEDGGNVLGSWSLTFEGAGRITADFAGAWCGGDAPLCG